MIHFESAREIVVHSFDMVVSIFADLYAFNIGCYVLWATAAAIQYVVDYLRTHDIRVFLRQVVKWSSIVAKSFVLLSLWVGTAPLVFNFHDYVILLLLVVQVDQPNLGSVNTHFGLCKELHEALFSDKLF